MTNEQAEQIIMLLTGIREQITRLANSLSKDGTYTFYSSPERPITSNDPNLPQTS